MGKKPKRSTKRRSKEPTPPKTEVSVSAVKVDLKGIGEAAPHAENMFKNMLKAIQRGIGGWYAPIGRAREAKADRVIANERANTILDVTRKQAELRILQSRLGLDQSSLGGRAMSRLVDDTLRAQTNREQIAQHAVEYLIAHPPEKDAPAEISDDWLTQFWDIAEKVGAPEIQGFYGRILARNAEAPGTTSPITLRVLSTLSPQVATRFEHFCRLSIRDDGNVYFIHPATFVFQNIGPLDDFGISYDDLFEFESYGLIRSAETIMTNHTADPPDKVTRVEYAGQQAGIAFNGLQIHRIMFTRGGADIRNSLYLSPIAAYTEALTKRFPNVFYSPMG
jgi:hypothetical protein